VRAALISLGYDGRHCAHGFRASARTILDEVLSEPVPAIEAQLAHAVEDSLARIIQCAVERCSSSVGETPTRQGSFQPVAVGTAAQEASLNSFPMSKGPLGTQRASRP